MFTWNEGVRTWPFAKEIGKSEGTRIREQTQSWVRPNVASPTATKASAIQIFAGIRRTNQLDTALHGKCLRPGEWLTHPNQDL